MMRSKNVGMKIADAFHDSGAAFWLSYTNTTGALFRMEVKPGLLTVSVNEPSVAKCAPLNPLLDSASLLAADVRSKHSG